MLIIGLGLIGGSFARSCRKNQIAEEIHAYDPNTDATSLAKASDVIDGFISLDADISHFDVIILATPLSTYRDILEKITDKISNSTIIIELGSVKDLEIKNDILPSDLKKRFIACHPIAGSHEVGFEHSCDDLFAGKKFIICPEDCDEKALKSVEDLAKAIGSEVEFIEAEDHNEIYALVSHLPQFLSFLTRDLSPKNITDLFFQKAFRLNHSNPAIWDDIFKINEDNIEEFYQDFFDNLTDFAEKFEENKFAELLQDMAFAKSNANKIEYDKTFLADNFATIFFRLVVVVSYLKVDGLDSVKSFVGTGFEDFTSIVSILNLSEKELEYLITKNQKKIFKLFESLM